MAANENLHKSPLLITAAGNDSANHPSPQVHEESRLMAANETLRKSLLEDIKKAEMKEQEGMR